MLPSQALIASKNNLVTAIRSEAFQSTVPTVLKEWEATTQSYAQLLKISPEQISLAACKQIMMGDLRLFSPKVEVVSLTEARSKFTGFIGARTYAGKQFGHGVCTTDVNLSWCNVLEVKHTVVGLDDSIFQILRESPNGRSFISTCKQIAKMANHDLIHQVSMPDTDFHYLRGFGSPALSWVRSNLSNDKAHRISELSYFSMLRGPGKALLSDCFEVGAIAMHSLSKNLELQQGGEAGLMQLSNKILSQLCALYLDTRQAHGETRALQVLRYCFSVAYRNLCMVFGHSNPACVKLVSKLCDLVDADPVLVAVKDVDFTPSTKNTEFKYAHLHRLRADIGGAAAWLHPIEAAAIEVLYSGAGLWRYSGPSQHEVLIDGTRPEKLIAIAKMQIEELTSLRSDDAIDLDTARAIDAMEELCAEVFEQGNHLSNQGEILSDRVLV